MTHRTYVERLLITIAIIGVAALLWHLKDVLLLLFASVLVAVILRTIANPIRRSCHLSDGMALFIAVAAVSAVFGIALWLFGSRGAAQMAELKRMIPFAWQGALDQLDQWGIGGPVRGSVARLGASLASNFAAIIMSVGNVIAHVLLVLAGGIFLAAEPKLYRRGLLKLAPKDARPNLQQALDDSWNALRLWLVGRLVSMLVFGVLTGLALWAVGIPAALALGVLAGLLEFVPFVGPIMAAIPGVLLALAIGPTTALMTGRHLPSRPNV